MKIETLKERITKAEERIAKKYGTIRKKEALIEKKKAQLEKTSDERDRYWIECDIRSLNADIVRLNKEIPEIEKTVEKYREQLTGEREKEKLFATEIPEVFKDLQSSLVEKWDAWDKERRERMREAYTELGYTEFMKKYSYADYEFRSKTDDEIHRANERDAEALILDLYNRVKAITGEVTDWSNIRAEQGTHGYTVLNGIVIGKEGRAEVESILAGGYNIQRLHVRVLVKEI